MKRKIEKEKGGYCKNSVQLVRKNSASRKKKSGASVEGGIMKEKQWNSAKKEGIYGKCPSRLF